MAGVKDTKKRAVLKKFLKLKKHHELTDRDVAKQCECSRALVKVVRCELIAAGLHPPITHDQQTGRPAYRPGASARGGYVYDEAGRVVREHAYLSRKAARRAPASS